jgi:hypothetical protein
MSFEGIPKTSSFMWVFPDDEKPLHKEIVIGHTPTGIQEVFYNVKECGWFDMKAKRVNVVNWKKVIHASDATFADSTRFFKRSK